MESPLPQTNLSGKYAAFIDVETTGQYLVDGETRDINGVVTNYKACKMLTMAAVLIAIPAQRDAMRPVGAMFSVYFEEPESYEWEQKCLDEFWNKNPNARDRLLTKCRAQGVSVQDGMESFKIWVNSFSQQVRDNLIWMSNATEFDFAWVNVYLSKARLPTLRYLAQPNSPAGSPLLDTHAYFRGIGKETFLSEGKLTNPRELAYRCYNVGGNPATFQEFLDQYCPYKLTHDASDDVLQMAWTFVVLRNMLLFQKL